MRASHFIGCTAMLAATAAQAQLSSTNCTSMGAGMVHCDTLGGSSGDSNTRYENTDWGAVFQSIHDNHVQKKIGKLLAAGDCRGALLYAVQEGKYDAIGPIKQVCPG